MMQLPVTLPSSGDCPIEDLVVALKNAAPAFGTNRTGALRSVRHWRKGYWANLGTLLHAAAGEEIEPQRDVQIGPIRLLSRPVDLAEIRDGDALARILHVWPGVDSHEPGRLQETVYPSRRQSGAEGALSASWYTTAYILNDPLRVDGSTTPDGPLFDPASGFFAPNAKEATEKWLGRGAQREYLVVIDDRRAVIRTVDRAETEITVRVDLLREMDVHVCARLTDFRGRVEDRIERVYNGVARITSANAIQEYTIYLLDGTPCWLDQRDSRRGWAGFRVDESDEPEPAEISALDELRADLDAGEGETVEFKEWIPPTGDQGKYRQLLDTVVAFANSEGGRIYIGVDDRGAIQGLDVPLRKQYVKTEGTETQSWRDAYAWRLKQNIAEGVTAEIRPTIQWIDVAGCSVLRITVPPGDRRPYQVLESREIFVRRGATSRRPSPEELRSLFYPDAAPAKALPVILGLMGARQPRWG